MDCFENYVGKELSWRPGLWAVSEVLWAVLWAACKLSNHGAADQIGGLREKMTKFVSMDKA